jgi:MinD-like ATPase involved in chromosome partitioning or flagellar assembly
MMSPPVVTFYSFKGGVGRTAALANVAAYWAHAGRTVATIDMDLEAPGLGMWLPPAPGRQPERGLLDLIREAVTEGKLPEDLSPFLYEAQWPTQPRTGRVIVLGAGKMSPQYAHDVAELRWDVLYKELDFPDLFRALVEALAVQGVERVLVDARTGFSDPAAVALHLASVAVLLFRPDDQNLEGMKQVLDSLRRTATSIRQLPVAGPLIVTTPGSKEEEQQQRQLIEALRRLELLPVAGPEEEFAEEPDEWAELADRLVKIGWHEKLATACQPIVRKEPDSLSLAYHRLAQQIDALLEAPRAEGAAASRRWPPDAIRAVLNADLGTSEGYSDAKLNDAFVKTSVLGRAIDPATAFIIGSKGAGKSALFRLMQVRAKEWYPNTTVVPVHGDVENLILLGTDDVNALETEEDFERFWVSYATARLERLGSLDHVGGDLQQLRQRVRELQADDPHPAFHRAASIARQVQPDQDVLLLIDATERLFGDRPLRQGPSFRGLGNAWLRWRSAVPFVRFKCFVREQALLDTTGRLIDRSHLKAQSERLAWEQRDAWWFLLRRLVPPVRDQSAPIPEGIRSHLDDEEPFESIEEIERALESFFPAKVYPGENEAPFLRWLWARVRDGNGSVYPRVLLGFARECQKQERSKTNQARESVFERPAVRQAFIDASKEHAQNLFAELDYLNPFLRAIKDDTVQYKVRYTEEDLLRLFKNASRDGGPALEPGVALQTLASLGILRRSPNSNWRREPYDYEIPAIYKFALKLPKGRV